jgi:predicted lysophospholipase L1 biosynthesis ABC-type transport system permease subunit
MRGLAARLDREYPQDNGQDGLRVVDLQWSCMDDLGHTISSFTMGLGIVVLLIASANLANLQLARAATRTREYAVRGALGASRWQLMRPLLVESVHLRESDSRVAIINEATARRFWPCESAIGKRFKGLGDNGWMEVIGVVGDVQYPGYPREPDTRLQFYQPLVQAPRNFLHLALRSRIDPAALTDAVRRAIPGIDPDLPVQQPGTVRAQIKKASSNFELVSQMLVCSAVLGLFLSALGIYGVVADITVQRTREIGIRLAMGATRADVLWLVLRSGVRVAFVGTAFGLAGAIALGHVFRTGMPALAGNESGTLVAVTLALVAVTLIACWLPARKATRVNPIEALRAE